MCALDLSRAFLDTLSFTPYGGKRKLLLVEKSWQHVIHTLSNPALYKGACMLRKCMFHRSYYFPRKKLKLKPKKDDGIKIIGAIKIKEKNEEEPK